MCYQLQSIISINQIGLAVWGWLFGGAVIAYEIATRPKDLIEKAEPVKSKTQVRRNIKSNQGENIFSSTLLAGIGVVVGLLIAAPPYSADARWKNALFSQDLQKFEAALVPGYLNPMNSYKYFAAIQALESSKLYDLAYKYAKVAVEFNPDNFDSWRALYFVTNSTDGDKVLAMQNMKRLDPKNPNVLG
jgi:tetratricopeptide (TPR) repeat protein